MNKLMISAVLGLSCVGYVIERNILPSTAMQMKNATLKYNFCADDISYSSILHDDGM